MAEELTPSTKTTENLPTLCAGNLLCVWVIWNCVPSAASYMEEARATATLISRAAASRTLYYFFSYSS